MQELGSFEARTHFGDLLRRVNQGEEFVITIRGRPIARMVNANKMEKSDNVEQLLGVLAQFRAEVSKAGPILEPGETLKDLARAGLKW